MKRKNRYTLFAILINVVFIARVNEVSLTLDFLSKYLFIVFITYLLVKFAKNDDNEIKTGESSEDYYSRIFKFKKEDKNQLENIQKKQSYELKAYIFSLVFIHIIFFLNIKSTSSIDLLFRYSIVLLILYFIFWFVNKNKEDKN